MASFFFINLSPPLLLRFKYFSTTSVPWRDFLSCWGFALCRISINDTQWKDKVTPTWHFLQCTIRRKTSSRKGSWATSAAQKEFQGSEDSGLLFLFLHLWDFAFQFCFKLVFPTFLQYTQFLQIPAHCPEWVSLRQLCFLFLMLSTFMCCVIWHTQI